MLLFTQVIFSLHNVLYFIIESNHVPDLELPSTPLPSSTLSLKDISVLLSSSPPPIPSKLHPNSNFYPLHNKGHPIGTFCELVSSKFRRINSTNTRLSANLSAGERLAQKSLSSNHSIVIKNADKGGAVVIQDLDHYIREAYNILHDSRSYNLLASDQSDPHLSEFLSLIDSAYENNIINKKERAFLILTYPIIPTYYHLPKIHKDITNPPGRPIIAGIGSLTTSQYIDLYLQKHVVKRNSYLKTLKLV